MTVFRPIRRHLAVFGLYVAAVLALTWPLVTQLGTHGAGEKFLNAYYIGRFLVETPVTTWLAPDFWQLNYPEGGTAILVALPQFFVAKVLAVALPADLAINLALLLHQAFGGYAAFRLSRRVWGGDWTLRGLAPHLAAGAVYGLCAHALAVFANGQPENCGLGYAPLALEGAWVLIHGRRWWGLPLLLGGTVLSFTSTPYIVMATLLAAWPLGLWALGWERSARSWAGALGVVACVGVLFLHYSGTVSGVEGRLLCPAELPDTVNPARVFNLGEDPLSALLTYPPIDHDVMVIDPALVLRPGRVQPGSFGYYGGYLGWFAVLTAALGLARMTPWARRMALLSAAGPLVLGLGPYLVLNGWKPHWHGGVLRLPLWFLQELPGLGAVFHTIQFPERLIPGTALVLALASARGCAWILERRPLPGLAIALVALPILEQLTLSPPGPPLPTWPYAANEAYQALGAIDDDLALVDTPPLGWDAREPVMADDQGAPIPPPINYARRLIRGAWTHQRPTPYGGCMEGDRFFHPSAQDSRFAEEVGRVLLGHGPGDGLGPAARELRAAGYGWYVVHTGSGLLTAEQERRLLNAARRQLELVHAGEDGTWLFKLPGGGTPR
ncbi:MAG: hypothetical protein H6739_12060 [Alphaproteobacteria bacterium]|nr:hypothetical protein [Alphaproteobacteria bacterium]